MTGDEENFAAVDLDAAAEALPGELGFVPVGRGSSDRLRPPHGVENPAAVRPTEDRIHSDTARANVEDAVLRGVQAPEDADAHWQKQLGKILHWLPSELRKEAGIKSAKDLKRYLRGLTVGRDAVNAAINGDSKKSAHILKLRRRILSCLVNVFQTTEDPDLKETLRVLLFEVSPVNAKRAFQTLLAAGVTPEELAEFYRPDVSGDEDPSDHTSHYEEMINSIVGQDGTAF